MPAQTIFFLPDPQIEFLRQFVGRAQIDRFNRQEREHFEGVEREARDKQITGAVAGAVFGGVLGPALGAASAVAGAATGAGIGSQFGSGDIAGGVTSLATSVAQGQKNLQLKEAFGFNPTDADRRALTAFASKNGTTPTQIIQNAKNAGLTVPQLMKQMQGNAVSGKEIADMADELNVTSDTLKGFAEHFGGDLEQANQHIQQQNRNIEAQQKGNIASATASGRYDQRIRNSAKSNDLELRLDRAGQQELTQLQSLRNDIEAARQSGELDQNQYIENMDGVSASIVRVQSSKKFLPRIKKGAETNAGNVSLSPLTLQDGTVIGYKESIFNPSDGTTRPGETHTVREIQKMLGRSGTAGAFGEMNTTQQLSALRSAGQALTIGFDPNKPIGPDNLPNTAANRMRRVQDDLQQIEQLGGQQQGQPQQQLPEAQTSPGQVHRLLKQKVAQTPIANWTPQELEQGNALSVKASNQIIQSGNTSEAAIQMLQDLIDIQKAINARRNRNP